MCLVGLFSFACGFYFGKKYGIENNSKKKRKAISQKLRNDVWNTYIGHNIGKTKCPFCDANDISMLNFDCAHVKSHKDGGNISIENLRPSCVLCNRSMGSIDMRIFIEKNNIGSDIMNPNVIDEYRSCYHVYKKKGSKGGNKNLKLKKAMKIALWEKFAGLDKPEMKCTTEKCQNMICMQQFCCKLIEGKDDSSNIGNLTICCPKCC